MGAICCRVSLYAPDWPQTHRDLLAPASQVLVVNKDRPPQPAPSVLTEALSLLCCLLPHTQQVPVWLTLLAKLPWPTHITSESLKVLEGRTETRSGSCHKVKEALGL